MNGDVYFHGERVSLQEAKARAKAHIAKVMAEPMQPQRPGPFPVTGTLCWWYRLCTSGRAGRARGLCRCGSCVAGRTDHLMSPDEERRRSAAAERKPKAPGVLECSAAKAWLDRLRDGPVHGEMMREILVDRRSGSYDASDLSEQMLYEAVAEGYAEPFEFAPTRSQEAFSGLQRGHLKRAWQPGMYSHWWYYGRGEYSCRALGWRRRPPVQIALPFVGEMD